MEILTDRQREVLNLIATGLTAGDPPTYREMGRALGVSSTNVINDHLVALIRKGALQPKQARKPRRYDLTDAAWQLLGFERCEHCGGRFKGEAA